MSFECRSLRLWYICCILRVLCFGYQLTSLLPATQTSSYKRYKQHPAASPQRSQSSEQRNKRTQSSPAPQQEKKFRPAGQQQAGPRLSKPQQQQRQQSIAVSSAGPVARQRYQPRSPVRLTPCRGSFAKILATMARRRRFSQVLRWLRFGYPSLLSRTLGAG